MGSSVTLYYGGYETTNIVIVKANKGIEEMNTLPNHLKEVAKKYEDKCKEFGLNPNFAKEALEKAEQANNDFNPIHGLIK